MSGLEVRSNAARPDNTTFIDRITDEAAVTPSARDDLRLDWAISEGEVVPQGAPVARLRDYPGVDFVAPMSAQIARVALRPGRRLQEIVLFREAGDRFSHAVADAETSESSFRELLCKSGIWPRFRRRPFGRIPQPAERPAAIFVIADDTRPLATPVALSLADREEDFHRGLKALFHLTDGELFLCHGSGLDIVDGGSAIPRLRVFENGPRHPHGLAGHNIHSLFPANLDCPVWELHCDDVADIGELLRSGHLPETRLVSVAGTALTAPTLARCQPGADLRGLCYDRVQPGPYKVMSGSPLDGREAQWLGIRDRQVTADKRESTSAKKHWFLSALTKSSSQLPVIPTAALEQALGATFPTMPMIWALASGDDEIAIRLGALSLLEEDVALADFVTGGGPQLSVLLRRALDRIEQELAT